MGRLRGTGPGSSSAQWWRGEPFSAPGDRLRLGLPIAVAGILLVLLGAFLAMIMLQQGEALQQGPPYEIDGQTVTRAELYDQYDSLRTAAFVLGSTGLLVAGAGVTLRRTGGVWQRITDEQAERLRRPAAADEPALAGLEDHQRTSRAIAPMLLALEEHCPGLISAETSAVDWLDRQIPRARAVAAFGEVSSVRDFMGEVRAAEHQHVRLAELVTEAYGDLNATFDPAGDDAARELQAVRDAVRDLDEITSHIVAGEP